jgi:hypothetical protein
MKYPITSEVRRKSARMKQTEKAIRPRASVKQKTAIDATREDRHNRKARMYVSGKHKRNDEIVKILAISSKLLLKIDAIATDQENRGLQYPCSDARKFPSMMWRAIPM